jgi:hypothetical protein
MRLRWCPVRRRRDPRADSRIQQADRGLLEACIRRDDGLQSINTRGLFPGGEGANHAGGIRIRIAEAAGRDLLGIARPVGAAVERIGLDSGIA